MNTKPRNLLKGLKSDRRKMAVAAGLLAVGALLWGRMFLSVPGPQSARAAAVAPGESATSGGGVSGSGEAAAHSGAYPGVSATAGVPRAAVTVHVPQRLPRDLFALDASLYQSRPAPPVIPNTPITQITPAPPNPGTQPADDLAQKAAAARARLTLQYTLLGDRPRANINGVLVGVGDSIGGLTVCQIVKNRVVLEMSGLQVTLDMQ